MLVQSYIWYIYIIFDIEMLDVSVAVIFWTLNIGFDKSTSPADRYLAKVMLMTTTNDMLETEILSQNVIN